MTTTITGLFDSYDAASAAVRDLEASGLAHRDISIVANNSAGRSSEGRLNDNDATDDAAKGAGIGAAVGAGGGLLAGLGLLAIPGIGPVVAAGWLASTAAGALAGAAVGGATGGLVGALTDSGVPEDEAHVYAEGVRRGGTLVTARVPDEQAANARSILQRHKWVDPRVRGDFYRQEGWSRFDADAPVYTREQIESERTRYGV
jgi:hypothetical protein